ncbi:MAG: HAD hydrolase-like protein [Cyclobacteriaceae bacterium]
MAFPVSNDSILVFAKDGVIFHSEEVRQNVYEELFSDQPLHRNEIREYNIKSIGQPQLMKFMHICGNILKFPNPEEKVAHYTRLAEMYLNLKMKQAPLVQGVREFIQRHPDNTKFVCSEAKTDEIEAQLNYSNLWDEFEDVYGHPHAKKDVLFSIKGRYEEDIIFFGDSLKDWQAAQEAGVQFIGIDASPYVHPLRGEPIHIVASFDELM